MNANVAVAAPFRPFPTLSFGVLAPSTCPRLLFSEACAGCAGRSHLRRALFESGEPQTEPYPSPPLRGEVSFLFPFAIMCQAPSQKLQKNKKESRRV